MKPNSESRSYTVAKSSQLPAALYTAELTRALDAAAISAGMPGFKLMLRAGHVAFDRLMHQWPDVHSLSILCGTGNNGGDGFVMAALAQQQGIQVQVVCVSRLDDFAVQLRGEARQAYDWMCDQGVECHRYRLGMNLQGEVIVDALLGTGLNGSVAEPFVGAIRQINLSGKPVLAVDIPSGLCSDTGAVLGDAVRADHTVTFIGMKQGMLTHEGVGYCGQLHFDSLRIADDIYESIPVSGFRTCREDLAELLPPRGASSHKGHFGHVLVIGGDHGMGGAAIMAAQAAGRTGAGLVSLATRAEHVTAALTRAPEIMVHGVRSGHDLAVLIERASVVVIGPGLGQNAWGEQLLMAVLDNGGSDKKPLVMDADALNLLVINGKLDGSKHSNWLLTPHPGEAARLLETSVSKVQADRFAAAEALQDRFGGTLVLKGAGTLSCDGDAMHLCSAGNPGMASGGMGDVLSGIIGALLAQKLEFTDAARVGVYIHGKAADEAAKNGQRGMQATDLLAQLPKVVNVFPK